MTKDAYGNDAMFCEGNLSDALRARLQKASSAARTIPPNMILNTPLEDLVEEFTNEFQVAPIALDAEAKFSSGAKDAKMYAEDLGREFAVDGTQITWSIPFTGDSNLFMMKPQTWGTTIPRGRINTTNDTVEIRFVGRAPVDPAQVEHYFTNSIQLFENYVNWQSQQIEEFNASVGEHVRGALTLRKNKVLADRELDASLHVPLESRTNPIPQYNVDPPKRSRPKPTIDNESIAPFRPEPAISEEGFRNILQEISSMASAVERLPGTFVAMPEESLRDVLLVILNNRFGPASGETFSRSGRTDIMIPYEGDQQAVFVAECKWWRGPSSFKKAIDQLLGYLTWRDTKAALIVFIKSGNPTEITAKAVSELVSHSQFKRDGVTLAGQSTFILGHEDDANREIQIALVIIPILGET
ncbi:MAG: hypothetical protein KTV68_18390 [Acidimicrobiia bacterium]|nr:hypothetical protein [Acidimicrobiia bacterium]